MLAFGPSVEKEVAQEFCSNLRTLCVTNEGRKDALDLLNTVLDDLTSKKYNKLVNAIVNELEHCHPDLLKESSYYQKNHEPLLAS